MTRHDLWRGLLGAWLIAAAVPGIARGGDAVVPGPLVEELPTLQCLGVRWTIAGDDNANARATVAYRPKGTAAWHPALDLFRVDSAGVREPLRPAAGQTLLAGSIFGLQPGTDYEVRLVLEDPDGGGTERTLRMTTWTAPQRPAGPRIDVAPGRLRQALADARPGDTLLLHAGVYKGVFRPASGEPGKPVALVAAGDGEAVLDGQGGGKIIDGYRLHDVIFEDLAFRNADWAVPCNEGARITLRRCRISDVDYGLAATRDGHRQQRFLITDCVFRGRSKWPRSEGIEGRRGVQLGGTGHVVCYNRISHFADAVDTFPAYPTAAIDIYGNEISSCTDDGIETDYSDSNVRCFDNRLTNVFQGISAQPVHGGPVYIFRNALYNVGHSTFKLHNGPSGVLLLQNTSVKAGMPLVISTGDPISNCLSRNNLYVGTTANYAFEDTAPLRRCDFDYDGFGGTWKLFAKYDRVRYPTVEAIRRSGVAYRHVVVVDPRGLFASGVMPPAEVSTEFPAAVNDLRPSARNAALGAGVVLPNVNDDHRGEAADLGAYQHGAPLPHYGPRP